MNFNPTEKAYKIPDPGRRLVLLLLFTTFVASALVVGRIYLTNHITFLFLLWNLFLAWIPFFISRYMMYSDTPRRKWYFNLLLSGTWLLFFPNAPYILTDLVHLQHRSDIPFWYDMMILLFFCFNSLFLAFASMIHMKRVIDKFFRNSVSHLIILLIFLITSLGVYIGRFERYNSWDIITDPVNLFRDVYGLFLNAGNDMRFLYMFFFLSLFLIINYFTLLLLFREMNQKESSHELPPKNN
jgi:uncharacterized membrane protein